MNATPLHLSLVTETFAPDINGVAVTLSQYVSGLVARGHQLQLIHPASKTSNCLEEKDKAFHNDNAPAEVITTRGYPIPMYKVLQFGWAREGELKRHFQRHQSTIVYIATEGPLGYMALRAAKSLGLPVISGFHTQFDQYAKAYRIGFLKPLVKRYLRRFHNQCSQTLVSSETMLKNLEQDGIKHLSLIPRGIDTKQFSPQYRDADLRKSWGLGEQQRVVLFVSRVAPEKNPALLIRAFRAMQLSDPELKLVVVGDGPLKTKLADQHKDIRFCGERTGLELSRHYASADLFVFPSRSETYGLVVGEAMASGLAMVGFNYAAPAAHIEHGINGLVADFDSDKDFIDQSIKLANMSPAELAAIQTRARETAKSLSWDACIDEIEHIFKTHTVTCK